ncbi:sterile alpha motif domain-containing protein 1 [Anguilla rostrata]|uniref:sterile alpha motif domain-containing protein 1 n=1 Tax=Anguilla rostrata TaxID=7938 RepID=UPI0030D57DF6
MRNRPPNCRSGPGAECREGLRRVQRKKFSVHCQEDDTPPPLPHPSFPRPLENSGSNAPAPHASIALETSCPPAGPAEGDCCVGTCHSLPAPPTPPQLLPRVAHEDGCPASDGVMEVVGLQDSVMEVPAEDRKGDRLPFQIFPDPVEVEVGTEDSLGCPPEKERLPSIVVEPTDVSEVESGELRWPPEDMDFQDEEDLFLEQCIPPANIADWGEDEEDEEPDEEEEGEESSIIVNTQLHASLIDEDFRDDSPTLLHDSAPALN